MKKKSWIMWALIGRRAVRNPEYEVITVFDSRKQAYAWSSTYFNWRDKRVKKVRVTEI